jgi:hypothetical protein
MRIAVAASPALRDETAFVRLREIVDHVAGFVVVDNCTDGDLDFEILSVAAVAIAAFAVPTPFSAERVVVSKLEKSVFVGICYQIDVPAATAISATGSATRNKLLPAEGNATMPAVACFDRDFGFVDEHKGR